MKKRNLFGKPKRRILATSKKRDLGTPKPKRRNLKALPDQYYIDKIIKSLSTPHREGGGTLFDKGLWEFFKLDYTRIPHHIYTIMLESDLIKREHCKGCGVKGYTIYRLKYKKKSKRIF